MNSISALSRLRRRGPQSPCARILLIVPLVALSGCMGLGWSRPGVDFGERLQPNVTKSVLVARINENVVRLHSWRSTDVKIRVAGVPVELSAQVAVRTPRNFRLRATSVMGEEADIGSNAERLWFWMRRGGRPEVITVRHDDVGRVRLPIPFQPDWLMEVMGVIPLDESQFVMHPNGPDGTLSLVGEGVSPTGEPITRTIRVEANYGLVLGHSLHIGDRTVATATLSDHRSDPVSGVILPHRIQIDWPQAQTSMTLRIGRIEVNPDLDHAASLWQIPTTYPHLDLSRQLPRPSSDRMPVHQPVSHVPAAMERRTVVTAQLEEPPWAESAVASAPVEPSRTEPVGRARVTFGASADPPQSGWRPAATTQGGRAGRFRAF